MNDLEFMQRVRDEKRMEKEWTAADFEARWREFTEDKPRGTWNSEREKVRLWMQIQNEAKKVMELADRKGLTAVIVTEGAK